tara:strand:+ start:11017 stop:11619 length:603 start_codon:yes stop_codon:yes gene_type:complete
MIWRPAVHENTMERSLLNEEYESILNTLFDEFFGIDNIKHTMGLLFNRVNNSLVECISSILTCLCSNVVNLNFTEHGFCPFKNEPFLLIPYDRMNMRQLQVVKQALIHCDTTKHFISCSQMGMGSSIFILENYKFERRLDVSLVMLGLYQLISTSKRSIHHKADVYSVMVQRLLKSVSVSPECVLRARKLCKQYDDAQNQ